MTNNVNHKEFTKICTKITRIILVYIVPTLFFVVKYVFSFRILNSL